jgi:hypothetical protein
MLIWSEVLVVAAAEAVAAQALAAEPGVAATAVKVPLV